MESRAGQEALGKGLIFAGESGIYTPEDIKYVKVGKLGADSESALRLASPRQISNL